jgi:hypothetical protein
VVELSRQVKAVDDVVMSCLRINHDKERRVLRSYTFSLSCFDDRLRAAGLSNAQL